MRLVLATEIKTSHAVKNWSREIFAVNFFPVMGNIS